MVAILVDDFEGDAEEFYQVVAEEVDKKEIPGVQIRRSAQSRSKSGGWFAGVETVPALTVADKTQKVAVIAYPFGRSFHVATRAYWTDMKFAQMEREGRLYPLEEIYSGCFQETVDRAVRAALVKYLAKRQAPVPPDLDPKSVFYVRGAQGGEG